MTRRGFWAIALGGILVAAVVLGLTFWPKPAQHAEVVVRYGVTPYQDSALPIVAERLGWYEQDGLRVELVPLSWEQVMPALRSGAIDAAIYNFNSFLPAYTNAATGDAGRRPVFYAPLFVFHGQAIMVHANANMQTLTGGGLDAERPDPTRLTAVAAQLRGKRIALTRGTELEQIVQAALTAGHLTERDVTIIHASPEDSLAAFISGDVDAFAAGLTERVEARKHGGVELVTQSDVLSAVTDGLVTTEEFAREHPDVLDKLVRNWFRTVQHISADVPNNSSEIRDYLRTAASTRYSPEEYAIAWSFDYFPRDASEAQRVFNGPASRHYWRHSWDEVSQFLIAQGTIQSAPPYEAYRGDEVMERLARQ
jgi:ABC-type nitrate/sulfonate/bicarbonate transport system substrate-binding protein